MPLPKAKQDGKQLNSDEALRKVSHNSCALAKSAFDLGYSCGGACSAGTMMGMLFTSLIVFTLMSILDLPKWVEVLLIVLNIIFCFGWGALDAYLEKRAHTQYHKEMDELEAKLNEIGEDDHE